MDLHRPIPKEYKMKQKLQFDRRHGVRPLSTLPAGTKVWAKNGKHQIAGKIISSAGTPRSYLVLIPSGQIQRNHHHLNIRKEDSSSDINSELEIPAPTIEGPATTFPPLTATTRSPIRTRSQTGTVIRPPERFTE